MARIVLIDDEARLLHTLARFLEQQGHEVLQGSSFQAVQEQLRPGRFEVLITDIVMPEFDGMKVLNEVVRQRQCQEPVILITGEPNLQTASEAVRLGAFDYISKPVTKDKLLEAVSRGLRHVQLLRERDRARERELQLLKNLAALGESASVLSHEIRTPITSLQHALRAVGEKLGVEHKILIEEFVSNLQRIERMLSQTLSFAKPLQPRPAVVDLGELVDGVLRELARLPNWAAMTVDCKDLAGTKLSVDPQLCGEVVSNLLRNAGEACGGKGHVEVAAEVTPIGIVIEVTDDGPGVPANLREEIFRPFRSSKDYGTGIGLAFCRKVIESHGGSISFVPKPGVGACIRIELPPRVLVSKGDAGSRTEPGAS